MRRSPARTRAGLATTAGPNPDLTYAESSGTSMAAPHVSGLIAGFLSSRPEYIHRPEDVKAKLVDTAMDLGRDRYAQGAGIDDAMRLMRSLPLEQNLDLVVRVVRVTLSSVNVRIEDIVEDATRRQKDIQDNIASLHEKVAELQEELEARRREIAAQEADFKETTTVKERLLLAEKSGTMSAGHRGAGGQNYAPSLDLPQSPSTQPPPPPSRVLPKPAPRE